MAEIITPVAPRRMSKAEQQNLLRLCRLNKDGAIAAQKERTKTALAEFEMRLASKFAYDQREAWADLMASTQRHATEMDRQLAEDCRRLGIPENFRPSINVSWYERGENASKDRRTELRRVAVSRLAALEAAANARIEDGYRRFQTAVLTAAIDSDEARQLLAGLPTAERLLPDVDYQSVTKALLAGPEAASLQWATDHPGPITVVSETLQHDASGEDAS
jgi:hypothetical protein